MSDGDDEIRKLLHQPATTNLMLLLVLGFAVFAAILWRSVTPTEAGASRNRARRRLKAPGPLPPPCNSTAPAAVSVGDTKAE